tara:strand:+ start:992 stop:1198 length:207 start_codon:yes stop_codon:yes gene_type:complete
MEKRKKSIHDLELHETLWVDEIEANVTKVASGWLYKYSKEVYDGSTGYSQEVIQIVFVPFDKTFHEGK